MMISLEKVCADQCRSYLSTRLCYWTVALDGAPRDLRVPLVRVICFLLKDALVNQPLLYYIMAVIVTRRHHTPSFVVIGGSSKLKFRGGCDLSSAFARAATSEAHHDQLKIARRRLTCRTKVRWTLQ